MRISVFANGIVDFLHPSRGEGYLRQAGFDAVALSLQAMIAEKKPVTARTSMPVVLIKAPSVRATFKGVPYASDEDVMRAAEVALKGGYITGGASYDSADRGIEPVYFLTDSSDEALIAKLIQFFSDSGIKVLITNRTAFLNGRFVRGAFSESRDAVDLINKYGHENLGFCFDAGEANLCGQDPAEMLYALKDVTDAVTVSENDGIHDGAFMPFSLGRVLDWGSFFRGMRKIGFDGDLIFDASASVGTVPVPVKGDKVKEVYRMAEYFRWQIEMDRIVAGHGRRVLFGAGNMCRNYMRDYGEKYPPLFTVDNDKKVWGSTFEGLEVKPPESLKELDEDTAVFICITYYKEVHDQLRAMGLKNPIEYYNDEYPNTVYEGKRLEREWTE